ncbi:glycosyltransferase family 2 protein [Corallincola platygyrae]|uniref:Glycosyltransferase family 2 protein n=1 Tax=Corallincola platygyrae TaxID=1193278 RepID=A0ABW4XGX2_9GAMM
MTEPMNQRNQKKALTIAIPTFDRNVRLENSLKALISEVEKSNYLVDIKVLDNCSPNPVSETLSSEVLNCEFLEVIRQPYNIGMCANILNCFEVCDTEWLWILGDDDEVTHGSVDKIHSDILNSESVCINFNTDIISSGRERISRTINGIEGVLNDMDGYSNLLFISTNIYRCASLRKHIRFGYDFAYSMQPHTALLFMSLAKDFSKIDVSSERIVNWHKAENDQTWSQTKMIAARSVLLELPLGLNDKLFDKFKKFLLQGYPAKKILIKSAIEISSDSTLDKLAKTNLIKQVYLRNYRLASLCLPLLFLAVSMVKYATVRTMVMKALSVVGIRDFKRSKNLYQRM